MSSVSDGPMHVPTIAAADVAWISTEEMIEIDRIMVEELHIELVQMMENAGRALAELVVQRHSPASVLVFAGSGGNGGGGLVAARHLANRGVSVRVATVSAPQRYSGVPAHQLDIVSRLSHVEVIDATQLAVPAASIAGCDVVIDAMAGYSLRGELRGTPRAVADAVNAVVTPVVALDAPSGLDTTTGSCVGAVRANTTMTLCLPKRGLRDAEVVGDLYLADISVPASVTADYGTAPRFDDGQILRIVWDGS